MYYKADPVSHHVAVERADLSRFTPLLHVDDNKSLSGAVLAKQRRSEVLGRTRITGKWLVVATFLFHLRFLPTTSHPSNATFRLYFPSVYTRLYLEGGGGGERVVLNNDLRCANISSLFLSWVSTWVYTSMKRTCEDLRSCLPPSPPVNPPLSAPLLRRTRKRDPIQVPKDILSSAWNIYSWYRYRFFPRAEWGMREREFALWELIRSLNVYGPRYDFFHLHHD